MTERQKKYRKEDLNNVIDEQILISQLSQGISFNDTDNMDVYERSYVLQKLIQLEKEKIEAKRKAIEKAKSNNN